MEISREALAFGLLMTIIGAIALYLSHVREGEKHRFMIECQNDAFKRYQCEALWRGSYAILDIPAVRNGLN